MMNRCVRPRAAIHLATIWIILLMVDVPCWAQDGDPRSLWEAPPPGCTTCPAQLNNTGNVVLRKGTEKDWFTLGWNWGDRPYKTYSDALDMNTFHGGFSITPPGGVSLQAHLNQWFSIYPDNNRFLWNTRLPLHDQQQYTFTDSKGKTVPYPYPHAYLGGNFAAAQVTNGYAIQFDPITEVDRDGNGDVLEFQVPSHAGHTDNSGAAFGFEYRNHGQTSYNSGADRLLYSLAPSGSTTYPALVLDAPWPNDEFYSREFDKLNLGPMEMTWVNGREMFVSINIRSASYSGPTRNLLTIRVPYLPGNSSSVWTPGDPAGDNRTYLKFSRVPDAAASKVTLPAGRGLVLPTKTASGLPTQFTITTDMLPSGGGAITISALILFDGTNNPELRRDRNETSSRVKNIGLEAEYHGNHALDIDWMRFESPHAQKLFRGEFDEIVRHSVQEHINAFNTYNTAPGNGGRNMRIEAFYGIDEAYPLQWQALRYFNTLLDGDVMIETETWFHGRNYSNRFNHLVREKTLWPTYTGITGLHAVPFYSETTVGASDQSAPHTLGFKRGYSYGHNLLSGNDPGTEGPLAEISSNYEVTLLERLGANCGSPFAFDWPTVDQPLFESNCTIRESFQSVWQEQLMNWMGDRYYPLFSGTPWYANLWAHSEWKQRPTNDVAVSFHRPKTGEELRQEQWSAVLMGAKGLLYHRATGHKMQLTPGGNARFVGFFADGTEYAEPDLSNYPNGTSLEMLMHEGPESGPSNAVLPGDFMMMDDPSNLDQYILPLMSNHRYRLSLDPGGADDDRIYLGARSGRLEARKMHDWIKDVEDTLVRLRMRMLYSRGYFEDALTMEADGGNSFRTKLENIIDLDATETRSMEGTSDIHTVAGTEHDMRFVDITYHEMEALSGDGTNFTSEAAQTQGSTPTVFYLGVQNRRTDPAVVCSSCPRGTPLWTATTEADLTNHRFYSTREFDSLVHVGVLDRYDQLGSREITLHFDYQEPNGEYALLHVRELGRGERDLDDGTYAGAFDAIVGQDKSVTLKFKPGEGKLLRIEILRPDASATGLLAHSNQRKLIAYPQTDGRIVYHMTYHHLDENGDTAVYYRRSLPTGPQDGGSHIVWEPGEANLSALQQPNSDFDCAYPSIVVRENQGIPTVYVVYACRYNPDEVVPVLLNMPIFENVFPANAPYNQLAATSQPIAMGNGLSLYDWGTPVVNASVNGNYYAWSDASTEQIHIGYKGPNDRQLLAMSSLSWNPSGGNSRHPSLNTYTSNNGSVRSNIPSLVWEELGQIYYAQIEFDPNTTTIAPDPLPLVFQVGGDGVELNAGGTIGRLSNDECPADNRFPVVYRSVESPDFWYFLSAYQYLEHDRVLWDGLINTTPRRVIQNRNIDYLTWNGTWSLLSVSNLRRTVYLPGDLVQPDVSQGSVNREIRTGPNEYRWTNVSDSAYVATFTSVRRNETPGPNSLIWHVPLNYRDNISRLFVQHHPNSFRQDQMGQYPHLSARPNLFGTGEWATHRRVFESGVQPQIVPSAQHFARPGIAAPLHRSYWSPGFSSCCSWFGLASVVLNELTPQERLLTYEKTEPVLGGTPTNPQLKLYPDTIRTEPFAVGDGEELSVYTIGAADTTATVLDLVRVSDGSRFRLPQIPATDTTASLLEVTLINGGGEDYRMEMYRSASAGTCNNYTEQMIIGEIPVNPTAPIFFRDADRRLVVNLAAVEGNGTVSGSALRVFAYPNPARREITLGGYRVDGATAGASGGTARSLRIRIYTSTGTEVASYEAVAGEGIRFDTDGLAAGTYFVRVEEVEGGDVNVGSFVVER